VVYPIIYRVSTIQEGAGFLPPTVFLLNNLQFLINGELRKREIHWWSLGYIDMFSMIYLYSMFQFGGLEF